MYDMSSEEFYVARNQNKFMANGHMIRKVKFKIKFVQLSSFYNNIFYY